MFNFHTSKNPVKPRPVVLPKIGIVGLREELPFRQRLALISRLTDVFGLCNIELAFMANEYTGELERLLYQSGIPKFTFFDTHAEFIKQSSSLIVLTSRYEYHTKLLAAAANQIFVCTIGEDGGRNYIC